MLLLLEITSFMSFGGNDDKHLLNFCEYSSKKPPKIQEVTQSDTANSFKSVTI